jgi:hypothetical protein
LEQTPVDAAKQGQELTHVEMVGGHGSDPGDQLLAHVFGEGFLVNFESGVIAALGGVFVQRALEEVQGIL